MNSVTIKLEVINGNSSDETTVDISKMYEEITGNKYNESDPDIDKITDSFLEEVTDVMNKFYPSEYIHKSLIYHKGDEDVTYINTFPQTEQNNGQPR